MFLSKIFSLDQLGLIVLDGPIDLDELQLIQENQLVDHVQI